MTEINTEQLIKEANDLLSEVKKPKIIKLPLSSDRQREVIKQILSSYKGLPLSKELVTLIREHVASHILKDQRLVGADVKYKFIVGVEGHIKKIDFQVQGSPVYDPYIDYLLEKAAKTGRKLAAVVDKKANTIDYSFKGGSNDLLLKPSTFGSDFSSRSCGYIRPNFKHLKAEQKSVEIRFKKLKQVWHWVKSICPIEVRWKVKPEKIHPHFGLPMSEFQELVDFWRNAAGLISIDEMRIEQEARKKAHRKWWQINRKK